MRRVTALLAMALLVSACNATETRSSLPPSLAPLPPPPSSTTTSAAPSGTFTPPSTQAVNVQRPMTGVLPNGVDYRVHFEPWRVEEIQAIDAGIVITMPDGTEHPIGVTHFRMDSVDEASFEGRSYTIPAGAGHVRIEAHQAVVAAFGDQLASVLDGSISTPARGPMPSLDLAPPLRWATNQDVPLHMEVTYESFVVRVGCGELALACSERGAVQVIPIDRVRVPSPAWDGASVWVESRAPRPTDSAAYLDPGPLEPRGDHDVLWIGGEMIVWGGADGDWAPNLIDGAAYDPVTDTWETLPPAPDPIHLGTHTRAVAAGDRMIVIAEGATLAFDPTANGWTVIGEGATPPTWPGFVVWTGDRIVMWSTGLLEFDMASGTWSALPHPGFGSSDRFEGALRVLDGDVYAIGADTGCGAREIARWDGAEWVKLPTASLGTAHYVDCSYANQTAAIDEIVLIWDSIDRPTKAYDVANGEWRDVSVITLPSVEGGDGPVQIGERVLVPQFGSGSIYDPAADTWTAVALPGWGLATDMVWTGEEVLMWGATCCYGGGPGAFTIDAWRWTPPS